MSRSQHKLKLQSKGKTYSCEMYTTPQEARHNLYAGKYVRFNKGGVNLYVPLTATLNSATESTPMLVYKNGDNTKYCIAQKSFYKVTVSAVANAVITAKAYNESGTQIDSWTSGAKWFPYGTRITASGVGNPSNTWNNPTLKIDRGSNTGETLTVSNINIGATAAVTRKSYSFTLNPGSNQTVTLKYTQPGSSQVAVAVSGSARTFTVLAGTTWSASITAVTTGFNAGSLNATSGTITGSGVTITATSATRKMFTLKLNGTSNQTITLKYTQPGSSQVTRTSTGSAQSWSVGYGTTWTASISPAFGYNAGTLSGTSGTVTGAVTISASGATAKTVTLRIDASQSGYKPWHRLTYTNTSGQVVSTVVAEKIVYTYTLKYNTSFTYREEEDERWWHIIYNGPSTSSPRAAKLYDGNRTWTSPKLTDTTKTYTVVCYRGDPDYSYESD